MYGLQFTECCLSRLDWGTFQFSHRSPLNLPFFLLNLTLALTIFFWQSFYSPRAPKHFKLLPISFYPTHYIHVYIISICPPNSWLLSIFQMPLIIWSATIVLTIHVVILACLQHVMYLTYNKAILSRASFEWQHLVSIVRWSPNNTGTVVVHFEQWLEIIRHHLVEEYRDF